MRPRLPLWLLFLCLSTPPAIGQTPTASGSHRQDALAPIANEDEAHARIASDMAKKAAKERVAALKHDTDKLLKLSQELKESVDKSNENVLSVDVIKKAEEIEKLAKSVKEKMKGPN